MTNKFIAGKLYWLKPKKINGWIWHIFCDELHHIEDKDNAFLEQGEYILVCLDDLCITNLQTNSKIRFLCEENLITFGIFEDYYFEFKEDCEAFLNDWEII